jgi:hypothetical protein
MSSIRLVVALRDLYCRLPETCFLQPWELQSLLWSLRYTDDLADEAEISAAVEIVREEQSQWRYAA